MGVLYLSSDQSLDDLIAAAQAAPTDNSPAMAEIIRRFTPAIVAIAANTTADWTLRQDAAQGALLGLVRAVQKHAPGTAGFKSYVRIYMKSAARRAVAAMLTNEIPSDPAEMPEPVAASAGLPFEFEQMISTLTAEQKAVVHDRYVDDLTVADIARGLGISVSAVSQRLKTIHAALRPLLTEEVAA